MFRDLAGAIQLHLAWFGRLHGKIEQHRFDFNIIAGFRRAYQLHISFTQRNCAILLWCEMVWAPIFGWEEFHDMNSIQYGAVLVPCSVWGASRCVLHGALCSVGSIEAGWGPECCDALEKVGALMGSVAPLAISWCWIDWTMGQWDSANELKTLTPRRSTDNTYCSLVWNSTLGRYVRGRQITSSTSSEFLVLAFLDQQKCHILWCGHWMLGRFFRTV